MGFIIEKSSHPGNNQSIGHNAISDNNDHADVHGYHQATGTDNIDIIGQANDHGPSHVSGHTRGEEHHVETGPWSNVPHNSSDDGMLEPIAIIGMSCRLPGSAQDLSGLWDLLVTGRSAWTPGPGTRFNMKAFQDASGVKAGATNTCGGHFLKDDVSAFDAAFFNMNPAEAIAVDPQHRLLLEMAFDCFEDAGLSTKALSGSNTGVYVGQWTSDYHEIQARDTDAAPLYLVTGTGPAISSNRISYCFNLRGPSFTIDSGCSSSSVALHQAVQSLRCGETSQAFVGGVNLLLDPQRFVYQSKMKMFSKEGRSFAFDSRANGYGRGEGCTGVMLKPLSAAIRDGDRVRAVIRNSVVNQDGRTAGLTLPSAAAQTEAILKAYRQVGLEPRADYVEAHGTGTKAGDPIEAGAIAAAFFTRDRHVNGQPPLLMGSIKANVGHLEAAAGLAGLIKAVLMLEHGVVPPQANFETANPDVLLDEWNLRIPTEMEHRPLRRISVNSFGYGGTNTHVVVDLAPEAQSLRTPSHLHPDGVLAASSAPSLVPSPRMPRLFLISAASQRACQTVCRRLAQYLVRHRPLHPSHMDRLLAQLSLTLGRHSVHAHRLALVCSSRDDLLQQLLLASNSGISRQEHRPEPRVAFVFSGQGAQYAEMGCELLDSFPSYRFSMERCRQQLSRLGSSWDLLTELRRPRQESRINEPGISQPVTTAVQLALVDLLRQFGIRPRAVVGHSSGEIAAAYAAGAISLQDAMTVSYFRGKLTADKVVSRAGSLGAMLAVGTGAAAVHDMIVKMGDTSGRMRIACFNSPRSVTVSGDAAAIDRLAEVLDSEAIFNRKLITNGAAYHSHLMRPIEKDYRHALHTFPSHQADEGSVPAATEMFSSLTGKSVTPQTVADGEYWVSNVLQPVLFEQAVRCMCETGVQGTQPLDMMIEVGPHSQLEGPIKQTLQTLQAAASTPVTYKSTLQRGVNARCALLECLGSMYVQGIPFRLLDELSTDDGVSHQKLALLSNLAPYPFDHDRSYWHETRVSSEYRHRAHLPHELLGSPSPDMNWSEPRWRRFIDLKETPWLRDHKVQGQVVFPAAGFITMAMQAILQQTHHVKPLVKVESISFRNVSIAKALVLPTDGGPATEVSFSMRPEARTSRESSDTWMEFRVFAFTGQKTWTEHCRGLVRAELNSGDPHPIMPMPYIERVSRTGPDCFHEATTQRMYHMSRDAGLDWQGPFANLSSIRTGKDACVVIAENPASDAMPGGVGDWSHPALLDSALFHGSCAILYLEKGIRSAVVPNFIQQLRIFSRPLETGTKIVSKSKLQQDSNFTYDLVASVGCDTGSKTAFVAHGVHLVKLPSDMAMTQQTEDMCHGLDWAVCVDAWTPEHRDSLCRAAIPATNSVAENQMLEDTALRFVQETVRDIGEREGEIPHGHGRLFFAWMKNLANMTRETCKQTVRSHNQNHGPLFEATLRIGPRLVDILTQKVDALSVLTPDNLLARVYTADRFGRCIAQMAEFCHALGRYRPGLRILEVGAGTASATVPILDALSRRDGQHVHHYDFTDISTGFFTAARERLGSLAEMVRFGVLDVERDAEEQGFEAASYDLIVASNVIHATQDIDRVLANMNKLLRPGGRFMLMEATQSTTYFNLIFGVFEGWWAGHKEGRCQSPLQSKAQWTERLERAGFCDSGTCFEDNPESEGGTVSVFVARKPPRSDARPAATAAPIHLLTAGDAVNDLADSNNHVGSMRGILPAPLVSVHSLSATAPPLDGGIVVVMPDICHLLCNDPSADCWHNFKNWMLGWRAVLLVGYGRPDSLDNAEFGLWSGFASCLRLEYPALRLMTLHLEAVKGGSMLESLADVFPDVLLAMTQDAFGAENDFAVIQGQLCVSRLMPRRDLDAHVRQSGKRQGGLDRVPFLDSSRVLTADVGVPGLLESLHWRDDDQAREVPGPDEIRLELRAASVNFKDVLIAAGQLHDMTQMQNDCSGVVIDVGAHMTGRFKPGDRVCAMYSRSYTNFPVVHGDCCHVLPPAMTYEEAASLPIVWTTVYYSLVEVGRVSKGDRILIHSAAGAVGQAAIILAQHIGADIFVTVGNASKRDLLHQRYGVAHDHIFSSRNTDFYDGILRQTDGHGVDVVLNSLAGEMFRTSCNLVAPFGRFVEIGRKDLMDDALMPMGFLLRNITFACVDLSLVIKENKLLARRLLERVVEAAVAGIIKPVQLTVMPISDIVTAFRHIQAGKHTGKVILRVDEQNQQLVPATPRRPMEAQLRSDATYIVIGGLGGLGRVIIEWMADHGAKHVVAVSRSGARGAQDEGFVAEMKTKGLTVEVKACDVALEEQVVSLLQQLDTHRLPPIRGVLHSAMSLRDSTFEEMAVDDWRAALKSKVKGTRNLHKHLPANLDFFITLSSIVALHGNIGQSNYAAACSYQDAVVRYRSAIGLAASSINVGVVLDAGFVSESGGMQGSLRRRGLGYIRVCELLAILDFAVTHPRSIDPMRSVFAMGAMLVDNADNMDDASGPLVDCRFAHLVRRSDTAGKAAGNERRTEAADVDVRRLLEGVGRVGEAAEIICNIILRQLGKLLARPAETLNPTQSLDSYGIDSLVAVELRNWIGAYLQASVQLLVLRGASSIRQLANIVAKESRLVRMENS